MSNASVIRPGLLVSVKSTVAGGVSYQREDLAADPEAEGAAVTVWKTKRVIDDPVEHEAATKCRSTALAMIRKVCSSTSFGLLCPADQEGALGAAIKAARALVEAFNTTATHTQVSVFALKGRVASNDAEAARAITDEIAGLVQAMDAGIKEFDPKKIREAADRAREMANMLSDEKKGKIDAAIAQARVAARTIVKRIEKEGEARELVMLDIQRGQIESARIAFLDLSGEPATSAAPSPAIDRQRFADLDLSDLSEDPGVRFLEEKAARELDSGPITAAERPSNDLAGGVARAREYLATNGVEVDAAAWVAAESEDE